MEEAIGAANGLVGSVLNHLSNEFVEAFVASSQLGLNSKKIKDDLLLTQGLLHEAQRRGVSSNPGLQGLLQKLSGKADQAKDALDELHYFIIQDQLDGTHYAVPDLGDDLCALARHGLHALRHAVGNCIAFFSCSRMKHGEDGVAADVIANNQRNSVLTHGSGGNDGPIAKLPFNRVAMSNKIKSLMEEMHSLCEPVSRLLNIVPHHSSTAPSNQKPRVIGSTIAQDTLYGRRAILKKTIDSILTTATDHHETLSVLPIVGPGGIGKTTFAQHMYNDERVESHFDVRVWVCVSTDFDVLKLSQQILCCIEGNNTANQTISLHQLQTSIIKKLESKRVLIVFDDIWTCDNQDWETLLAPLKKGPTMGNMVLVTTRVSKIAEMVKTIDTIELKGLEFDDFFTFFKSLIFGGNKPEYDQVDLDDLASEIAKKLKGSPLAAKTVGRLLRKEISRKHWMEVLENNKWQKEENGDGIMTSLRISYDYLPFHLKKCFPYFALFPEDYRFKNLEITYFWIAIGIIEKDEDYMEQLVDNGFLMKENNNEDQYYVLHDLLHELARTVSSQECLNIYSTVRLSAGDIPESIRHLSITMEDKYEGNFKEEMEKLKRKVDISNLRSLMIFREYGEIINGILEDTFKNIKGLRVLYAIVKSPNSFAFNFLELIHLRFLKIKAWGELSLPSTLSRLYHLKLLDLSGWNGSDKFPKDMNRLINLHHFIAEGFFHSNIPEVGKMEFLKELKEFHVKKESVGYELSELGELTELGGKLSIYNLEKVATKEEAMRAKLVSKCDLEKLRLLWKQSDVHDGTAELSHVLDGLEPHHNLPSLSIVNHGGPTGPRWLCGDVSVETLKSLHLEGVSWVSYPPFGQLVHLTSLTLIRISGLDKIRPGFSGITGESFMKLKEIVLIQLPDFIEWIGGPNAQSFSRLETIICKECPNLVALPFLQECSTVSYNHLWDVSIHDCHKLSMPPMPHTPTLPCFGVYNSPVGMMKYNQDGLTLENYSGALACHNMAGKVQSMIFGDGSKIPWAQLPEITSRRRVEIIIEGPNSLSMAVLPSLTSLTRLSLFNCGNITVDVDGFNPITAVNLKELVVLNKGGDGPRSVAADLLSQLVVASRSQAMLPAEGCFQLEGLMVDSISAVLAAPVCSLFAATLRTLYIVFDKRVESFTEEEESALQLLTSLQELTFWNCPGLPSLPRSLQSLPSLRYLSVMDCPQIQSLTKEVIPTSLRELHVMGCSSELEEQANILLATNPDLSSERRYDMYSDAHKSLRTCDVYSDVYKPWLPRLPAQLKTRK